MSPITAGTILEWNADFYEVLSTTRSGKSARICRIGAKAVGHTIVGPLLVPNPEQRLSAPERRRVVHDPSGYWGVRLDTAGTTAFVWNGTPVERDIRR